MVAVGPATATGSSGIAPIRTCVGCRKRAPQHELVRFVRGAEASIVEGRTLPGRGAWLCKDTLDECRQLAERRGAFARAFGLGDRSPGRR